MKAKLQLFYHLNRGQLLFIIINVVLILFIFFVIILGNISTSSFQFAFTFKNFVSLRSLAISGLRYALYQINQDPNFATSSAQVLMPQGNFVYSVSTSTINQATKLIKVRADLANSLLTKILKATATIDSNGKILNLEVGEE